MRSIREARGVARLQWKEALRDWRMAAVLLLLLTGELQYTRPLFAYVKQTGVPTTPWLLPVFLADPSMRLIVDGCAVLLLCNLFRSKEENISLLARCGKRNLILGKVLYLTQVTLAFILVSAFLVLLLHPLQVYFSAEWGPLLGSWGRYYGRRSFFNPVTYITENYSAIQAVLLSGALLWMAMTAMGLIVLILSLHGHRVAAIASLGAFLLLDYLATGAPGLYLMEQESSVITWISPLSWCNLSAVNANGRVQTYLLPSLDLVIMLSIGNLLILFTVIVIVVERSIRSGRDKKELHWTA